MAENVRAGLENGEPPRAKLVLVEKSDVLDRVWHGKPVRVHVREFAAIFSLIFLAISAFSIYKRGPSNLSGTLLTLTGILLVLGYQFPRLLHPVWDLWMKFAEKLGVVMTFVILMIAWVGMMIPIGFLLKVLRIRVMDTTFRAPVDSYWEPRAEKQHDFKLLERQF